MKSGNPNTFDRNKFAQELLSVPNRKEFLEKSNLTAGELTALNATLFDGLKKDATQNLKDTFDVVITWQKRKGMQTNADLKRADTVNEMDVKQHTVKQDVQQSSPVVVEKPGIMWTLTKPLRAISSLMFQAAESLGFTDRHSKEGISDRYKGHVDAPTQKPQSHEQKHEIDTRTKAEAMEAAMGAVGKTTDPKRTGDVQISSTPDVGKPRNSQGIGA